MSSVDDLVAWLRAQFDEDERVAREARQDALVWQAAPTGRYAPAGWIRAVNDEDSWAVSNDVSTMAQARHIALHDPARVLREVEAKRAIIDEHAGPAGSPFLAEYCEAPGWCRDPDDSDLRERMPCRYVRLLASVYADRPGYREEWKP